MAITRLGRRQQTPQQQRQGPWRSRYPRGFTSRRSFRLLLVCLAVVAILPPVFFHFKLKRFHQKIMASISNWTTSRISCLRMHWPCTTSMHRIVGKNAAKIVGNKLVEEVKHHHVRLVQDTNLIEADQIVLPKKTPQGPPPLQTTKGVQLRRCGWLNNPPLVCAHGGDSNTAFPNTLAAYLTALHSQVDCIELDVSRSSDGVLFALHDRDLQQISGNSTSKVGYMSAKEIKELMAPHQLQMMFEDLKVPTIEDALKMVSSSVRHVVLDAKVGPPLYERNLAKDILSVVKRAHCKNCIVWAKSDHLVRDVMMLSPDTMVGYIVMIEHSSGARSNLLRMRNADVVGIYHPLVDDKVMKRLHGRNKKVYAWTVDDADSMKRMLYENVDAVVTSNPTLLQRLMQDTRTQCLEEGFSFPR